MGRFSSRFVAVIVAVVGLVGVANADPLFDQDVTPGIIFGSGNANGSFTVVRTDGIELGLRAKLRFDASNLPQNIFNSNGDGTYSFAAGIAPGGFSFDPNSPTTPIWSFEWSVNTDFDGSSGSNLGDYTYEIKIDFDEGAGTDNLVFDPITPGSTIPYDVPQVVPFYDHSIGDNTTTDATDQIAGDAATYQTLLDNNNVAQNSWNMEFFNSLPFTFDPTLDGNYDFMLSVLDYDEIVASVMITVVVGAGAPPAEDTAGIPEPTSLALLALGAGLALARRRTRPRA